jgi:cysteine peptidase C11 family protein
MTKNSRQIDRVPEKAWTIAVFMVGGAELGPSLSRDLMEMERAGSNERVNVIVSESRSAKSKSQWLEIPQRNGGGLARRTAIGGSNADHLDDRLGDFLDLAITRYPARHYLLVMWGHASGLLFGQLGPGSAKDQLRLRDLGKVLGALRRARSGRKLDILGFCACALSKAEFALELREEVDYLVASQVGISTLMTWPFDDIIRLVLGNPAMEPASLARELVHCFEESYEPPPVGLTALDLQKSETIARHVNGVAESIIAALQTPGDRGTLNKLCVLRAFTEALDAHPYDVEPVVDFFDLCRKLVQEEHLTAAVRQRARLVLDEGFRSFVVENARSGPKLAALHGLSIVAPDLSDPANGNSRTQRPKAKSKAYLWQATEWARMIEAVREFAMSREESDD